MSNNKKFKFEVGSTVKCICKCSDDGIKKGEKYVIIKNYRDGSFNRINFIDSIGCNNGWLEKHFRLVSGPVKVKKEVEFVEGMVYYDKNINRFSQLREITSKCFVCSVAKFFGDSNTTISVVPYSKKYVVSNFEEVVSVSDFAVFDSVGWRVKEDGD